MRKLAHELAGKCFFPRFGRKNDTGPYITGDKRDAPAVAHCNTGNIDAALTVDGAPATHTTARTRTHRNTHGDIQSEAGESHALVRTLSARAGCRGAEAA